MLIGRQPELTFAQLCNLFQTRLELISGVVFHSSVLDEHCVVPSSISSLYPAVIVNVGFESVWSNRLEGFAEQRFDLFLEDGEGHAVNGVFQALPECQRAP